MKYRITVRCELCNHVHEPLARMYETDEGKVSFRMICHSCEGSLLIEVTPEVMGSRVVSIATP